MSLPDYQLLMLPSLQTLTDGEAVRILANEDLMDEDIREQTRGVDRGVCRLKEKSWRLLTRNPEPIDNNLLEESPRYTEWMRWLNVRSRNRIVIPR